MSTASQLTPTPTSYYSITRSNVPELSVSFTPGFAPDGQFQVTIGLYGYGDPVGAAPAYTQVVKFVDETEVQIYVGEEFNYATGYLSFWAGAVVFNGTLQVGAIMEYCAKINGLVGGWVNENINACMSFSAPFKVEGTRSHYPAATQSFHCQIDTSSGYGKGNRNGWGVTISEGKTNPQNLVNTSIGANSSEQLTGNGAKVTLDAKMTCTNFVVTLDGWIAYPNQVAVGFKQAYVGGMEFPNESVFTNG